jgi:predicted Zn-dependent protease
MKTILVILLLVLFQPLLQASETVDNQTKPDLYEQDILKTIKKIQTQDFEQALDSTRNLLAQYPKSRLGQMIYADLLLAKAGPLKSVWVYRPIKHNTTLNMKSKSAGSMKVILSTWD